MTIVVQVHDSVFGRPAAGAAACLKRADSGDWATVARAVTDHRGRIAWADDDLDRGLYWLVLDSDSYFASLGVNSAYSEVIVNLRISNESNKSHIHVTLSPYCYSTYFSVGAAR